MTNKLTGTKKQIRWAQDIREDLLSAESDPESRAWAEAHTSASWWIDRRHFSLRTAWLDQKDPDRGLPLPEAEVRALLPEGYDLGIERSYEGGSLTKALYRIHFRPCSTVEEVRMQAVAAHQHRAALLSAITVLPGPPLTGTEEEVREAAALRDSLCLQLADLNPRRLQHELARYAEILRRAKRASVWLSHMGGIWSEWLLLAPAPRIEIRLEPLYPCGCRGSREPK
jgi:hypothetical protein